MLKRSILVVLVVAAFTTLVATYPTEGARAFAVSSLNEFGALEAHYSELLSYAEAKRDWTEAEMAGEEGYLQTAALRMETRELKRIRGEYAHSFNVRYTIFTKLGLI